nr:MAG TPA: hypothetical protein [Bacteriophage sp.]
MTKKILLKWLEGQKAAAIRKVDAQEQAAFSALLEEKLRRTDFAALVAYVLPRLNEVYDYITDWHKKNEELAGPVSLTWSSIMYSISNILLAPTSAAKKLQEQELKETRVDQDLRKRFSGVRREVEKTYNNVAMNLSALANAKLGLEYLRGLGFDLTGLLTEQERPVETALAVPIDTSFLLITSKEDAHGSTEI